MSTRTLLLAALAASLFGARGARAQAPSTDLQSYVLFADSELHTMGTKVTDGDLGVNSGRISASHSLSAPNSIVAADTVHLDPASTCDVLFSNNVESTG